MKPTHRVRVLPVTAERWDDFEQLFGARGAPHYCWCTPYRFRDAHEWSSAEKKAGMQGLVSRATPVVAGKVIEYKVPSMFERPWAKIWEEYHEKGMQRPPEKELLKFD